MGKTPGYVPSWTVATVQARPAPTHLTGHRAPSLALLADDRGFVFVYGSALKSKKLWQSLGSVAQGGMWTQGPGGRLPVRAPPPGGVGGSRSTVLS